MSRDASAGFVGAIFGLVFVLVNAGQLDSPYDLVIRALGVVAFVAVAVLLFRTDDAGPAHELRSGGWQIYRAAVIAEVIALVGGAQLLNRSGHSDLSLPWVVIVVGVHFFPLAWAFRAPFFHVLAGTLLGLGIVGGALALAGADRAVVALVSGVGAGAVLLAFAARPALTRRARATG